MLACVNFFEVKSNTNSYIVLQLISFLFTSLQRINHLSKIVFSQLIKQQTDTLLHTKTNIKEYVWFLIDFRKIQIKIH